MMSIAPDARPTVNSATPAEDLRQRSRAADARSSDLATGLVLLVTSSVACALLVAEVIFGVLWTLSAGFREYATLLMR